MMRLDACAITSPMDHSFDTIVSRSGHALVRSDLAASFDMAMFSSSYWEDRSAITATAQGRGTVLFVQFGTSSWVLRQFFRGGLIGRLIRRSYLFTGLERSRSFRELRLLAHLAEGGLAVPRPVAALCERRGLFYRAALLTEAVPHDRTLFEQLAQRPVAGTDRSLEAIMTAVGEAIGTLHALRVDHADLNAHNILLSENQVAAIIDFDRGRLRSGKGWQAANLQRLQRSLTKALTESGRVSQLSELMESLRQGYRRTVNRDAS